MLLTHSPTEAVRRAVRAALLAEAGDEVEVRWDPAVDAAEFLEVTARHRVAQLLHGQAEVLDLPDEVRDALAAVTRRERLTALALARELADVSALFAEAGIGVLAMKGPCLAQQTTGDLAGRGRGDLDLLVRPDDVARAHRLVEDSGWRAWAEQPRPGPSWGWRHLLRTGYEIGFDPGPGRSWPIDLHWQLQPVRRSQPDVLTAWQRRTTVEIAGRPVPTLDVADAFLHSCSHAAKDGWTVLRSLVDVHRLARRPEVWRSPLRHVDLWSLAATEAAIGLPATVPDAVRDRVAVVSSTPGRTALRAQEEPEFDPARFPLLNVATTLRRNARLGAGPGDVGRLLAGQFLAHRLLTDIDDERAVTAVPRALAKEARRLPVRTAEWWSARG